MASTEDRKRLTRAYKQAPAEGGVVAYVCAPAGKRLIVACPDIKAQKNRFAFSVETGSCILAKLGDDWKQHGPRAFSLEVLEELKQGETQERAAFLSDLETLAVLWREKYSEGELY